MERDGRPCAGPRGNKAWALLAYLLRSRRPPARRRLAELLFSEADDPLGALRWNLAQIRQALDGGGSVGGDPVELVLEPHTRVDLALASSAEPIYGEALEALCAPLLEGMSFPASPAFEAWLTVERCQLAAATQASLLEQAQAALGTGRPGHAARLASRLLELNPLEEAHHEILVRSLIASDDLGAARARAEAGDALLSREHGVRASRLGELVEAARARPAAVRVSSAAAVRGNLEAGQAAIAAGAVDTGLASLRLACEAARRCEDAALMARAQLALGSALVHSMRAYGEAAIALHAALDAARTIGANEISATAHRELAFVDVQAGRRERAEVRLSLAAEAAVGLDSELASIAGVRGMGLSDSANYEEALACFAESVDRARRCGGHRQVAWSLALGGRVHVLTHRHSRAREHLRESLVIVAEEKWLALAPLPEALLAHVDLAEGRIDAAAGALEHAFTIACQLTDPCWEGIACRGIGLVEAERGHGPQALTWLLDGRDRCTRVVHPYRWIHAWVLDGLCAAGEKYADERSRDWIAELETLASQTGMRELLLRAYEYRLRAGDVEVRDAARLLRSEIDNPALAAC
jgi:DNA-binding SARP family transcriptional activator